MSRRTPPARDSHEVGAASSFRVQAHGVEGGVDERAAGAVVDREGQAAGLDMRDLGAGREPEAAAIEDGQSGAGLAAEPQGVAEIAEVGLGVLVDDVVLEAVAVEVGAHAGIDALAEAARITALDHEVVVAGEVAVVADHAAVGRGRHLAVVAVSAYLQERAVVRGHQAGAQRVQAIGRGAGGAAHRLQRGDRDLLAEPQGPGHGAAHLAVDVAGREAGHGVVGAERAEVDPAECARRAVGAAGDDVDDAEEGVGAVHRRDRAADHLDAVDLVDADRHVVVDAGELVPRLVDGRAVDQDQDAGVEVGQDLQAAHAQARAPAIVDDEHAGHAVERLRDGAVAEAAQAITGDDGDRRGHAAERLLALGRADHDVLLGLHGRGHGHLAHLLLELGPGQGWQVLNGYCRRRCRPRCSPRCRRGVRVRAGRRLLRVGRCSYEERMRKRSRDCAVEVGTIAKEEVDGGSYMHTTSVSSSRATCPSEKSSTRSRWLVLRAGLGGAWV